jgi:hypothetical protein
LVMAPGAAAPPPMSVVINFEGQHHAILDRNYRYPTLALSSSGCFKL